MNKVLLVCLFLAGSQAVPLPEAEIEPMGMAEPEPMAAPLNKVEEVLEEVLEKVLKEEPIAMAEPRISEEEQIVEHKSIDEESMAELVMEPMAEPVAEYISENAEPIVYNIVDDEKMYNNFQKGEPGVNVAGNYAFEEDGKKYQINYQANDAGYVAEGDLPVAPPVPVYEMLVPVPDTAEVMAAQEAHKHLYRAHQQLVEDALKPKESGVEALRRRRSPVVIPQPTSYISTYTPTYLPYYRYYPTYTIPQIVDTKLNTVAQTKTSPIVIQPVLDLQHPIHRIGFPVNSPVPNEVQEGEEEPAALAL